MNITNTTKDFTLEKEDDSAIIIAIGILILIACLCYFCNRNEQRDREEMQARADRAQGRLEIRYG